MFEFYGPKTIDAASRQSDKETHFIEIVECGSENSDSLRFSCFFFALENAKTTPLLRKVGWHSPASETHLHTYTQESDRECKDYLSKTDTNKNTLRYSLRAASSKRLMCRKFIYMSTPWSSATEPFNDIKIRNDENEME